MRTCRVLGSLVAALVLSACAQNQHHQSTTFLDQFAEPNPTPSHFIECHGFGCAVRSRVALNKKEWQRVAAVFRPRPKDARTERQRIAHAVSLMQQLVGKQTGTAVHQWTHKNMEIVSNFSDPTQLDCIDESVNTWTYMTMMERDHLFRFHRVAKLSNAGGLHDPRNTAVMQEIKSGEYFAIDAALVDYGVPPPVLPLATWMGSWPPDLSANQAMAQGKKGEK